MIRVKRILYPTDFSSYSNQAYLHAVALAENHGASLIVLFVYSAEAAHKSPPFAKDEDSRAYWRRQLEQIRPIDPGIAVDHLFVEGDPAREIVRHATELAADLVVMGTHGRTGLQRLLMGSVAEHVLREAPCSVLVVKLPKGSMAPERPEVVINDVGP